MIKAFVENGRLLCLLIAVLLVSGLGGLNTMPRTEDPQINVRMATVITHLPGGSAERVEALLTEPIENRLRKLAEIKLLSSVSRPGVSVVRMELKDEINEVAPVWSKARDLLTEVNLPRGSGEPRLDDDKGYAFTRILALVWKGPGELDLAVLGRYASELNNRLRAMSGTAYVEIFGKAREEILVELDQRAAASLNMSAGDVSARIGAADAKISAGTLTNAYNQLQVELEGSFDSIERIRAIPLAVSEEGFTHRVGDLAEVKRQVAWPLQEVSLIDGKPGVVVAARMNGQLRIDQWSERLDDEIERFAAVLPANVELQQLFDQSRYTNTRLSELLNNILLGFAIIVCVLLLTLGWRSALIVSASLPLTVLFTLACMKYYGLAIHQMSVTGLVVALGIMVDNAIVMTDSIQQRRQKGVDALSAVKQSVHHLWLPLLGSTLTTILAFMPIVLMPGASGEFVGALAFSVIFSLIGSYLISHSLVAGMAGRWLQPQDESKNAWWHRGIELPRVAALFTRSLELSMRFPKSTMALVMLVPLMGFKAAGELTEQFFPPSDRDMFQIELFLPVQSSISFTQQSALDISARLQAYPEITSVRWFVGNSAPSFYYNLMATQQGARHYAQAMVTTEHFSAANRLIPELQERLDAEFPQAQILVRKLEQGPPFDAPLELRLYGPNLDRLKSLGDEVRRIMMSTTDVIHTRASLQPGTPKLWLQVDEEAALMGGSSLQQVAVQLQDTLVGRVDGSILESTEAIGVRVRVAHSERFNADLLGDLRIASGQPLGRPLHALAEAEILPSRGAISRRDGERVNTLAGYLRAGVLPATALAEFQQRLDQEGFSVPNGYRLEFGGESAKRDEAVGSLLADVGVVLSLLITVVVLSFNSFRISALILLTAVQSAGLGLLCVYLFDYPFGFTVIIALLGLMGLAINAAIVILAELKADPKAIHGDTSAIMHGVLSCTRHISSTTITTVGGFLPLILAGGGFWPPFAVAIAGGTLLTTLLSFYFVPSLFLVMARFRKFELSGETKEELALL